jgi:NADPH:quinone reductase
MTAELPPTGRALRSLITTDGRLELSLVQDPVAPPADDEIVMRVQAAPINPSDLGLLLGPADLATLSSSGEPGAPKVVGSVPPARLAAVAARLGQPMPVGNEGAGVVVAAGTSAQHLIGRSVAALAGGMYAEYRTIKAAEALVLPAGTTPDQGASAFVNPLTALGMVETMRSSSHSGLVHTAAASNLGQMLNRICLADGIPLVNIVRSPAQAEILRGIGAAHVCDSSQADFTDSLVEALAQTGATLAFDAVGGGTLAAQILAAMEAAANRKSTGYSRYGSKTFKQVYIYGTLNNRPTEIARTFGTAWSVGGWLLTPFLETLTPERRKALRDRVAAELTTTFASRYTAEVRLDGLLDPDILVQCSRRATGEKVLLKLDV